MNNIIILILVAFNVYLNESNCEKFYTDVDFVNLSIKGKVLYKNELKDVNEIVLQSGSEINTIHFFKNNASKEILDFSKKDSYLKKDKGKESFSIASFDENEKLVVKIFENLCD